MIINTYIVPCPHCGSVKRVAFSVRGRGVGDYVLWSDGRIEGDGWLEPAQIQQCPECGKFFLLPPRGTLRVEDQPGTDTGLLSYLSLKRAISELSDNLLAESWARLEAWWAYNALYKDTADCDIPVEEKEFNHANMQWLLELHTRQAKWFSHLVFELNRLLGNRDVCERMIAERTYERYVSQRKERFAERGVTSTMDDKTLHEMYEWDMHDLTESLNRPLVPYIKK